MLIQCYSTEFLSCHMALLLVCLLDNDLDAYAALHMIKDYAYPMYWPMEINELLPKTVAQLSFSYMHMMCLDTVILLSGTTY